MKTIASIGALCVSMVVSGAPPAMACAEFHGWLTEAEIAAYRRGERVEVRFRPQIYQGTLEPQAQTDPWRWQQFPEFGVGERQDALAQARWSLRIALDAPVEFDPIALHESEPLETSVATDTRPVESELKQVALGCDGRVLTGSNLL